MTASTPAPLTAGAKLRAALAAEKPLQVVGAINAYAARMAEATGFRALYLSGGGVAANSLGLPDLGISTMDDVLIDIRRITEASPLPLLVDADTGWGGAFNIARTVRSFTKAGAAGFHIEDQVQSKRCGRESLACQHFEENDAERIYIACHRGRQALQLFWTRIGGCQRSHAG